MVVGSNLGPAFQQQCRHGVGSLRTQVIRSFVSLGRRRLHATVGRRDEAKLTPPTDTLTALYRVRQILPAAVPQHLVQPWSLLVQRAGDALSGMSVTKSRIAVLGLDELSRSKELVSSLLEDPLFSNEQVINSLRKRPLSNDPFTISNGEFERSSSSLRFPNDWLRKLNAEIVEIPTNHPEAISLLHDADVRLIIGSPMSAPLPPSFYSLFSRPLSFLILQYPAMDQMVLNYTVSHLSCNNPSLAELLRSGTSFVYTPKAVAALDIFRRDSTSLDAIQTFQHDFLASGISDLSGRIAKGLEIDGQKLKDQFAQGILAASIETCREATKESTSTAGIVQHYADSLRLEASNIYNTAFKETLGEGGETSITEAAMRKSTKEMEEFMATLPWWKLLVKIDDFGHLMTSASEQTWCKALQAQLDFQTGKLALIKSSQISNTFSTLNTLPPTYQSQILLNELQQLASKPPEVRPSTLTYPISYRLKQVEQPTLKLHRFCQRSMIMLWATSMASIGGAYAGWLFGYAGSSTAIGLGALGFVVGLRWFIARWEKGKRRWWQDWNRAGEGLERDLKEALKVLLNEKILGVPLRAADALEKMASARQQQAATVNEQLDNLLAKTEKVPTS
ncbi:hypothetical protein M422DRAFT_225376 [Sphaerobolus stellatus SS14]|nr:hypothetical protein M422DRAFT_225376 [Sphaerobolus stellatus SS14]